MSEELLEELNYSKAKKLISELIKSGVRSFVISPGSRSTALVLAAAENPLAEKIIHFDERGSSFHALGIAKSSRRPVATICTSGTALANMYPAIIEASLSGVPLIIVAADRPPELRNCGANQSIDQVKIFGNYLRYEVDLLISDEFLSNDTIATTVNQAVYKSMNGLGGPVLINAMFREPLFSQTKPLIDRNDKSPLPKTVYHQTEKTLSDGQIETIADDFSKHPNGLIVVGALPSTTNIEPILQLAMKLQWPIFADPLSNLRAIGRDSSLIPFYNHILLSTLSSEKMIPSLVLHLGGPFVSKTLLKWIESIHMKRFYHIDNSPNRVDPIHKATDFIEMRADLFAEALAAKVESASPSLWLSLWKEYSLNIEELLGEFFHEESSLTELGVVNQLLDYSNENTSFFLGNSLPIRYFDTFFFPRESSGQMYANRGASGIDGNLATALGVARGSRQPVIAVVGDLTFLHDLNTLALVESHPLPIVFVVLNNFGGGIFQFLPTKNIDPEVFEKLFQCKHSTSIGPFVKGFNIPFYQPNNLRDFQSAIDECLKKPAPSVIELLTDSESNLQHHREIENHLRKKMSKSRKEKELCYFAKEKIR